MFSTVGNRETKENHVAPQLLNHFELDQINRDHYIYKKNTRSEYYISLRKQPKTHIDYYNLACAIRDNVMPNNWLFTPSTAKQLQDDDNFVSFLPKVPYSLIFKHAHKLYIKEMKKAVADYLLMKRQVDENTNLSEVEKQLLTQKYQQDLEQQEKKIYAQESKRLDCEIRLNQDRNSRVEKAEAIYQVIGEAERNSQITHLVNAQTFIENLVLDAAIAGLPAAIKEIKAKLKLFNNKDGIKIWLPQALHKPNADELELLAVDLLYRADGNYYRMEKPELAERLSSILLIEAEKLKTNSVLNLVLDRDDLNTEFTQLWQKRSPTFHHLMSIWKPAQIPEEINPQDSVSNNIDHVVTLTTISNK